MRNFLIRMLLTALALIYLAPLIDGMSFGGATFSQALACSFLFALTAWFTNVFARALALTLRIKTLKRGLTVLLPVWLSGWWLLPVLELLWLGNSYPAYFQSISLVPAIYSGLLICLINALTSGLGSKKKCGC